jgi:ribosomal protein S4E
MSENTEKPTIQTPVSKEDIDKFRVLDDKNNRLALRYLELEEEKVKILRVRTILSQERQKLFESLLLERGLPPNFPVEINGETGVIIPVEGAAEQILQSVPTQEETSELEIKPPQDNG